jgi:hypothetical protein
MPPPPRRALRCRVCGLLRGTGTNPARAAEAAVRHEHDYRVTFGEPDHRVTVLRLDDSEDAPA